MLWRDYSYMVMNRLVNHISLKGFRSFSTKAAVPAVSQVLATDMTLRALLRNLKLLGGMRNKDKFNVIITGLEAHSVAEAMSKLEPCINFEVDGDSSKASFDLIEKRKDGDVDSVIVVQPYHVLESNDFVPKVYDCLSQEDGTIGFIWTRSVGKNWVAKYQEATETEESKRELLPKLEKSEFVLNWLEKYLKLEDNKFAPLKHRKYINKLEGNPSEMSEILPYICDSRVPFDEKEESKSRRLSAIEDWLREHEKQKESLRKENGTNADHLESLFDQQKNLNLDLHIFHTQVIPKA